MIGLYLNPPEKAVVLCVDDAVEIHGAHGYLLDQFLWARTNQRSDGYGGALAQRTRFPAEVVAAVRVAVGPNYPVIFRFRTSGRVSTTRPPSPTIRLSCNRFWSRWPPRAWTCSTPPPGDTTCPRSPTTAR